jgi:hypothetical protein
MANFAGARGAAHSRDYIVTRVAARFVDEHDSRSSHPACLISFAISSTVLACIRGSRIRARDIVPIENVRQLLCLGRAANGAA